MRDKAMFLASAGMGNFQCERLSACLDVWLCAACDSGWAGWHMGNYFDAPSSHRLSTSLYMALPDLYLAFRWR